MRVTSCQMKRLLQLNVQLTNLILNLNLKTTTKSRAGNLILMVNYNWKRIWDSSEHMIEAVSFQLYSLTQH